MTQAADAAGADSTEPDPTLVGPFQVQVSAQQVIDWLNRDEVGRAMVTSAANGVIAEALNDEVERRGREVARLRAERAGQRDEPAGERDEPAAVRSTP